MKPNQEKEKLEDRVANIVYSLFKILVISINQPDELSVLNICILSIWFFLLKNSAACFFSNKNLHLKFQIY